MYGLIGNPLGHSFSATYFNAKFQRLGIDEEYRLFPLESISMLPDLLREHPDLHGFNVTIPYKQDVFEYLDCISPDAREIGAVNTVKIITHPDGHRELAGFNTDWIGFRDMLTPLLNPDIDAALIVGSGGGAKAVAYALYTLGIEFRLISRSPESTPRSGAMSYGDIISYEEASPELVSKSMLIINTTPLGMWPNTETAPALPYDSITPRHICIDIVYNPAVTEFMKRGAAQGATVKNGLEMLHNQAEQAWKIWSEP